MHCPFKVQTTLASSEDKSPVKMNFVNMGAVLRSEKNS